MFIFDSDHEEVTEIDHDPQQNFQNVSQNIRNAEESQIRDDNTVNTPINLSLSQEPKTDNTLDTQKGNSKQSESRSEINNQHPVCIERNKSIDHGLVVVRAQKSLREAIFYVFCTRVTPVA